MTDVQALLGLQKPPIAIGFLDSPPEGVPYWSGSPAPAGCYFWKKAQEGQTFYTLPSDHYNCAVGAYTHHIALPEERAGELEQTVGFMVTNDYIALEEVPGIPSLPVAPNIIAYGPAESAPFPPSVVVIAAQPAQAMLLYEAAIKAGAGGALLNTLGRPGCAVLPLALQNQSAAISLGCKGNRVFTGLPDTEMYLSIPGDKWPAVSEQIARALQANQAMAAHYQQKQTQFAAS
jgi:uncharacterized protein (DUF169 family)